MPYAVGDEPGRTSCDHADDVPIMSAMTTSAPVQDMAERRFEGDHANDPKPLDEYPDLMTLAELRTYLRIGRTKAYRLVDAGEFDVRRIGARSPRVTRDSVRAYLNRRQD